jgi:hypothetical protein
MIVNKLLINIPGDAKFKQGNITIFEWTNKPNRI